MKAYGNGITKKEFVAEMKRHQKADAFMKGKYWVDAEQKGCAVGCGLRSVAKLKGLAISDYTQHDSLGTHLGIPTWLARLEDTLFEGVSVDMSKKWPVQFAQAINPGADLDLIRVPFLIIVLKRALKSAKKVQSLDPTAQAANARCIKSVKQTIAALRSGDATKIERARSKACTAADAAKANAADAAYTAAAAACTAANAAYADAAADAAAAYAVAYAAYANDAAADAAVAYAAYANAADAAVASSNRTEAYEYFAKKLLRLMQAYPGSV